MSTYAVAAERRHRRELVSPTDGVGWKRFKKIRRSSPRGTSVQGSNSNAYFVSLAIARRLLHESTWNKESNA